jgi:flagellar M-ring protein FliF
MAETGKTGTDEGVGTKALAVIARGQKVLKAMPPKKRTGLLAGGLMLAAVLAAMFWFFNRTEWRVLYSGLEPRDAGMVEQELAAAGIAYRTTSDESGVEVPAELLDKARMEVAAKGMPQTGRLGFELFDKPNWVGSEFDEKVNYQRALEGELEHTIGSLGAVKSARVHLVLPAESLFAQEAKVAKASVVLKLRKPELATEQVESIRRLVAGAVENLAPENVTLVDADGRLDLQAKDQHAHEGDAEQALEEKLVAMLEPTVGVGNVRAIVNAEYDDGAEERTDEVYDPTLTAPTSMQRTEQLSGAAAKPSGVPGTASNTPAAAPVGAVQGSAAAAAPGVPPLLQPAAAKDALPVYPDRGYGQNQTMKEESETYAVTRHTLHRQDGPGRLRRMTVAVVVNDRMTTEGAGKLEHTIWKPRSGEEMHRLEGLAQAAVGYDLKRGDSVVVENVGFSSNLAETPRVGIDKVVEQAKEVARQQPATLRAGMMAFLWLLVVLLVLRPVAKQVVTALQEPKALPAGAAARAGLLGVSGTGQDGLGASSEAIAELQEADEAELQQRIIEDITDRIQKKPVQSTKLVEQWINGPQETA